jgi:hypothetical protein
MGPLVREVEDDLVPAPTNVRQGQWNVYRFGAVDNVKNVDEQFRRDIVHLVKGDAKLTEFCYLLLSIVMLSYVYLMLSNCSVLSAASELTYQ